MKKSAFRNLIREEIEKVLNEENEENEKNATLQTLRTQFMDLYKTKFQGLTQQELEILSKMVKVIFSDSQITDTSTALKQLFTTYEKIMEPKRKSASTSSQTPDNMGYLVPTPDPFGRGAQ